MRSLILLFLVLFVTSAGLVLIERAGERPSPKSGDFETAGPARPGKSMSLVALLADPQRRHQERVAVAGFLVLEFEHLALYLDQTSQEAGLQENGVWIDAPISIQHPAMKRLSRTYVVVDGRFDATAKGYGNYSGTLTDIRAIRSTLTEREFRRMQVGWAGGAMFRAVQSTLFYACILTVLAMIGLGLYRLVRRLSA